MPMERCLANRTRLWQHSTLHGCGSQATPHPSLVKDTVSTVSQNPHPNPHHAAAGPSEAAAAATKLLSSAQPTRPALP
jgi:hypothetical protein